MLGLFDNSEVWYRNTSSAFCQEPLKSQNFTVNSEPKWAQEPNPGVLSLSEVSVRVTFSCQFSGRRGVNDNDLLQRRDNLY
jgi:hypothetical protein